ncbi:Gustatory receptor 66b [Halyomorpha halys]|nr:Gustatory receptor 66b [Halyomorpha halys]
MSRSTNQVIKSNFIFIASKYLGLFPFRLIDNELEIDKHLFLYSLIISTILGITYIGNGLYLPVKFSISKNKRAPFNFYVTTFNHLCRSFIIPYSISCLYYYRNTVLKTVHSIDSLHSIFREIGVIVRKRPALKEMMLEIFAVFVLGVIFYVGGNTLDSIVLTASFVVILMAVTVFCGQFSFLVNIVSDGFQSSSNFLKQIMHAAPFNKLPVVERLAEAVCKLVSTSSEINSIYSQQLLIIITSLYTSIISHIYWIFINATLNDVEHWYSVAADLMLILFSLYLIWHLTHCAAVANNKSKEFNALLYQLMIDDWTNEIRHSNKLKLHIAMQQEVVFNACGFFNLDYTLVHSMIASATTYLVILIQFGLPDVAQLRSQLEATTNLTTTPLPISFTTT